MKTPALIIKILTSYFRWLAVALVVLILVFGYLGLIANKLKTIQTTGFLEQKKVQSELASRQQLLDELTESIQRFEVAFPASKLQALDQFIPSSADFPGLMLTIRNVAAAANLQLDSITVSDVGLQAATGPTASTSADVGQTAGAPSTVKAATAAGVNLQVQNVSIAVSGTQSYEAFKSFVAIIESSQRLMDVVSLGFSLTAATEGQSSTGGYSMQIRTYYLPRTNQ